MFNIELKRARPALGTIVTFHLEVSQFDEKVEMLVARAFDRIEELELKFSKFQPLSDVTRLNQTALGREIPVSREFARLMPFALDLWRRSKGAFAPFELALLDGLDPVTIAEYDNQPYAKRNVDLKLDLSGVAKGFVVDELVEFFKQQTVFERGVINAGGDLRFFNVEDRHAEIRLKSSSEKSRFQTVIINEDAFATSSFQEFRDNPESQTHYFLAPRAPLTEYSSVSVIATTCTVADALTKVGWFAEPDIREACAAHFEAHFLFLADVRRSET